jgi:hypothetical protein
VETLSFKPITQANNQISPKKESSEKQTKNPLIKQQKKDKV